MRRLPRPNDRLRTTPSTCRGRDPGVFPEAHAAHAAHGSPTTYAIAVGVQRVCLMFEDFHLPYWIAGPLQARHAAYLAEWERAAPRSWPRYGVGRCDFRGSCLVTVRREDADVWVRVLRAATLEAFNPEARESWLRRALATLGSGDTRYQS